MASSGFSAVAPPSEEIPFLSAVELTVFHTAVTNYKIHGQFLRDDAVALHWVFGDPIITVLEMIDEDCVTVMKSPASGKVILQVYGKTGEVYWIPPGSSMCQCLAYHHNKKRDYCKHVLAAHFLLAIAPPEEYDEISDRELMQIFQEHFKNAQ